MGTMASQITSLTIVYSTIYSDADQRKHQSSASLAFVRGIHRWPVNSRTNGRYRGKCFHLMTSSCKKLLFGRAVLYQMIWHIDAWTNWPTDYTRRSEMIYFPANDNILIETSLKLVLDGLFNEINTNSGRCFVPNSASFTSMDQL